jgi:anti-anti-sigma regulatory factor
MAGLQMQLEEKGNKVFVKLEGTFDGRTALELRKVLDALGKREVVLDFTHVRHFVDFAVAVLTRELDRQRIDVQLRGLPTHHERVFRYFGFGTGKSSGSYYQPEERFVN